MSVKLCQHEDGKCSQCGEPMQANWRRPCIPGKKWPTLQQRPVVMPAPRATCQSLGEPTGEVELIKCETCHGNVRVKFAVNHCAIFGKCLPTYTGDDPPHDKCHGCTKYVARK